MILHDSAMYVYIYIICESYELVFFLRHFYLGTWVDHFLHVHAHELAIFAISRLSATTGLAKLWPTTPPPKALLSPGIID